MNSKVFSASVRTSPLARMSQPALSPTIEDNATFSVAVGCSAPIGTGGAARVGVSRTS